jgi:hypothetical protein
MDVVTLAMLKRRWGGNAECKRNKSEPEAYG